VQNQKKHLLILSESVTLEKIFLCSLLSIPDFDLTHVFSYICSWAVAATK